MSEDPLPVKIFCRHGVLIQARDRSNWEVRGYNCQACSTAQDWSNISGCLVMLTVALTVVLIFAAGVFTLVKHIFL